MSRLREKVKSYLTGGSQFKHEFIDQLRLLIIVTLGFTIAFSWRQTTFDAALSLVKYFTGIAGNTEASVLASVVITIISLGIILITSKLLQNEHHF